MVNATNKSHLLFFIIFIYFKFVDYWLIVNPTKNCCPIAPAPKT
jgi:hypothetical protein